ncbi:MAG: (2Fe-2S)-binding protein [Deltaproteobacteria bacterium]|nr:(2Fe-2S)-binding protein [Deltaproteobacteria bacterium]
MSTNPKEKVKITVDGKEVLADKGENLLKVLLENKAAVPHYCYHPGLSIAGACRMCFVEVEGQPRPLISCNATVAEGMRVKTTTEKVKEIQKWNLAFHLINHPLDCPICDQAGECGLQNYYMKYGKYNSDMQENKVLKRKVISIGAHVMLDTERCILCSRCVRFFDEVSKTGEMAIFNRGDRSEIGTYQDKALNNNYTLNSVDICPVGALTSKDFRFKKRVWFLKDADSICPGCSTGCNVTVSFDPIEKRTYRMRPRLNEDVNGYWMCDYGRMRYKQTQPENF